MDKILYICGSNRKGNCYKILNDLREKENKLITLADKSINYCLGCNSCTNNIKEYCVIDDDMYEIYKEISKVDKIVIASPIYMNHITGLLKNMIDRFNPYSSHDELLKGKTIYLITAGQMSEEENKEIATNIKQYFEGLGEFMEFEVVFLKNLSSGDIDDVTKMYDNYKEIIRNINKEIHK